MILKNCSMKAFSERCVNKKIACYGIGGEFERIIKAYSNYKWIDNIAYLVDGNERKQGISIKIYEHEYIVSSLVSITRNICKDTIFFITCTSYYEVFNFLQTIKELDECECYIFHFMYSLSENDNFMIKQTNEKIIPSKIHYCWFGGGELPDLYKKCIDSWYRWCPSYEIIRWDENNCNIDEIPFTRQAYDCNKFGFVPDYFRLKIIYENGGIYLDTDVEILKNIDALCYNDAFCGLEFPGEANLGLGFGARKNHPMIKYLMERYKTMSFVNYDGSLNEIASPVFQSEDLIKHGMSYENKLQIINEMTIYPIEVLSPQNVYTGITNISKNSYLWHHFDGSWLSGERLKKKQKRIAESKALHSIIISNGRNNDNG